MSQIGHIKRDFEIFPNSKNGQPQNTEKYMISPGKIVNPIAEYPPIAENMSILDPFYVLKKYLYLGRYLTDFDQTLSANESNKILTLLKF